MSKIEINFNLSVSNGEITSFITNGSYEKNNNIIKICFIEQTDIAANTEVYIYDNKVIIKRYGQIQMDMTYIENEETMVNLTTDFNYQLSMRNFTHKLNINQDNILIIYQTETDIEQQLTHTLCLKWSNIN